VDEALCVGWIDGIRKSVDEISYKIRFTPRRRGSIWSAVNIKRVGVLSDEGRMRPTGLKAFAARKENKSGIYSYEQRRAELEEPYNSMLKKNKAAWTFFQDAKKEETRMKRLEKLIEMSVKGKRL
jgi:uncharacterized protein YdeI (YjbR/CyaY-like superfamily)